MVVCGNSPRGCRFDICELHVFSLFKSVFDGLFVHIYFGKEMVNENNKLEQLIETYRNQMNEEVDIKGHVAFLGDVYLAFQHKSSLFEKNSGKEIRALDQDVLTLEGLVQLIKQVIEFSQRNQHGQPIQA